MDYFSIDIETTGLDPDTCQVLQIGAVYAPDALKDTPVELLSKINILVKHPLLQGEAYALHMNAKLLLEADHRGVAPEDAGHILREWIGGLRGSSRFTAAGKNFAGFDRRFLRRLDPVLDKMIRHRVIDPAPLYYKEGDAELPNTEMCVTRMLAERGMILSPAFENIHDAVGDAQLVIRLLRHRWGGGVL